MHTLYAKHLGAQHRISASCISLWFSRPVVSNSATTWTTARQASLSLTISRSLPKYMFTASHPVDPLLLPSIFPSVSDFSNESSIGVR